MKKSIISRRKFLTGVGATAGAVAVAPTIKSFGGASKGRGGILNAWMQQVPANPRLRVVRVLSRKPGTYLLPLAQRSF